MKIHEFFTDNKHPNLFSRIEVRYRNENVVIYYTPLVKRIISIDGEIEIPIEVNEDVQRVFDWIKSDSNVELIKIKKRR